MRKKNPRNNNNNREMKIMGIKTWLAGNFKCVDDFIYGNKRKGKETTKYINLFLLLVYFFLLKVLLKKEGK